MAATKLVVNKVQENPQITLHPNVEVVEFQDKGKLQSIVIRGSITGNTETLHPKVFSFLLACFQIPNGCHRKLSGMSANL
jgi:thioredoxin reductase